MGAELRVKVSYEPPLEGIMSRRQPRETERNLVFQEVQTEPAVRSCGMEALGEPQHRTKVKLRKALGIWVSVLVYVTPDIQSRSLGSGAGGGGTLCVLTQGDLMVSTSCGTRGEDNNDPWMRHEKSDHLIRALKPGNAGGAKEVTG
jgi:hypothetical protein